MVSRAGLENQGCEIVVKTTINVLLGDITEHVAEFIVSGVDDQRKPYGE